MYDVAIIGAGVVGACAARELARYKLETVILEKESGAAMGSSGANSGLVHAGYDPAPGTLKAKYNMRGQRMFDRLSGELDFPFKRNGALVVVRNESDIPALSRLRLRGEQNGLKDLRVIGRNELRALEPNLRGDIAAALAVPSSGIVNPYAMTIALLENAVRNGSRFIQDCKVTGITKNKDSFLIQTTQGEISAKAIVNAAGMYSDEINNMLSARKITILPRRGEYVLFDKIPLVKHTIFQLPADKGKGVLITPTVDGNLLIGPSAEDIRDKDDVSTTASVQQDTLAQAAGILNEVPLQNIIASFSGIRSGLSGGEFIIEEAPDVPGLINLCGIDSPGLTAAPAIGAEAAALILRRFDAPLKEDFNPVRKGIVSFQNMTIYERKSAVSENPDYGTVVCRCESVTKAEILEALRSQVGAGNLDALKRATRAGMGRCQSGFCLMRLPGIIAEERGVDVTDVTKRGGRSNILIEANKSGF